MKKIITYLIVAISVASCDRKLKPAQFEGTVNITATVLNPRDSIGVNDTVKVRLEIQDTINYNGTLTALNYKDRDASVQLKLYKIDKTHAGSIGPAIGGITLAAFGYLNQVNVIFFQKNGNKLKTEYNFVPKSKGVFFIEQQLDGDLFANDSQYQLKFKFNYGNINRNHQMLIDSAGTTANFNLFLQDHIVNGYEIYGFKVN